MLVWTLNFGEFIALTRTIPLACYCAILSLSSATMTSTESVLALLNCHPLGLYGLLGILPGPGFLPWAGPYDYVDMHIAMFEFDLS